MNTVSCDEARELLPAYGDGELDLPRTLQLERHIEGCVPCAAALRQSRALSQAVRGVSYHRAPDTLRARLRAQLLAEPTVTPAPILQAKPRTGRDWSRWAMPLAASIALAVGINILLSARQSGNQFDDQLITSHVRSLQGEHLSDVASSDQHTVKPWFAGKLDYSPPVRNLAQQDYPLIGGRLDYVANKRVAALVYHHSSHVINLYVWPDPDNDESPSSHMRDGYSMVHWCKDHMEYWAVSDLNQKELRQFAELQIAATADAAANAPNT